MRHRSNLWFFRHWFFFFLNHCRKVLVVGRLGSLHAGNQLLHGAILTWRWKRTRVVLSTVRIFTWFRFLGDGGRDGSVACIEGAGLWFIMSGYCVGYLDRWSCRHGFSDIYIYITGYKVVPLSFVDCEFLVCQMFIQSPDPVLELAQNIRVSHQNARLTYSWMVFAIFFSLLIQKEAFRRLRERHLDTSCPRDCFFA